MSARGSVSLRNLASTGRLYPGGWRRNASLSCTCKRHRLGIHLSFLRWSPSPSAVALQRCTPLLPQPHTRCHSSSSKPGIPFLLADIGEGIKEVEVLQWHVAPGDAVQQFDPICTVQSDKATVEITSRYDGVIQALATPDNGDNMLQVGQPLLYFVSDDSSSKDETVSGSETSAATPLDDPRDKASNDTVSPPPPINVSAPPVDDAAPSTRHGIIEASPAVRRLCREHGLALTAIAGTGPQQRVLKADVLAHLAADTNVPLPSTNNTTASPPVTDQGGDVVIPLRGIRRAMVQSMTAALSVPHMCLSDEVCLNALLQLRQQWPQRISLLAWWIKALTAALRDVPHLNGIHQRNESDGSFSIVQRHNVHLGLAMDTPHGLVVPVLTAVQDRSLAEIDAEIRRLQSLALANALPIQQQQPERTFTLSNIGSLGAGLVTQPVLVPPTLAMVTIGRMQVLPRYKKTSGNPPSSGNPPEGDLFAASMLPVTWAADHRFVDGASLARLHRRFAGYLEEPLTLVAQWK